MLQIFGALSVLANIAEDAHIARIVLTIIMIVGCITIGGIIYELHKK